MEAAAAASKANSVPSSNSRCGNRTQHSTVIEKLFVEMSKQAAKLPLNSAQSTAPPPAPGKPRSCVSNHPLNARCVIVLLTYPCSLPLLRMLLRLLCNACLKQALVNGFSACTANRKTRTFSHHHVCSSGNDIASAAGPAVINSVDSDAERESTPRGTRLRDY